MSIAVDESDLEVRCFRIRHAIDIVYPKFVHREIDPNVILGFWKTMADSLPNLAKAASQILTVPTTSASVERAFSAAGQVISEHRSKISPDLVDDILFLRSTKKMK